MDTKLNRLTKNCGKHHIFCAFMTAGADYAYQTNDAREQPYPKATIRGWLSQWKRQLKNGERP